jgi:acyl-CoA synthetase (AMP-forming)/AMP-acid ligase II
MKSNFDLIWMASERTPNQLAIVDDRTPRTLTYRELIEHAEKMAAGFHTSGIRQGHRVAIALPNCFEQCLVIIALQRLGAVPALINAKLPAKQIADLICKGEMHGAVIPCALDLADAVSGILPGNAALFCAGDAQGLARSLSDCTGDVARLPACPQLRPDDPTLILYTSGTTGTPKGIVITNRATNLRVTWVAPVIGLRCGDEIKTLGVAPLNHAIGCHGTFLATLALNGTYYVMSAFDGARAVEMIARHRITYLLAVPTVFQAMISAPNYKPEKLHSLKHIVSGGATISPRLLERISQEWPGEFINAYGSTEANFALYSRSPTPSRHRILQPGFPTRIRVVRFDGGPEDICRIGEAGELLVDATVDGIFCGYLDNAAATNAKLRDGWYFTGDIGVPGENGEVELIGRTDDMIRSGGEAVYPEEVEAIIAGHPGVAEVCVTGIPNQFWGQAVVACVVRRDQTLTCHELDQLCRMSALAGFKRPKAYCFVNDLPKNHSNKIQRGVLVEHVLAETGRQLQFIAA